MPTPSLAGTVKESKAQRQERLKTRFRDRGGIFVPSDGNPLVDILLARGINGESPVKKRAPRKSVVTPKPRSSTASSRVAKGKTPRTGSSKRAARKSAAVPTEEDENHPPPARKRRGGSKTPKLPEGKRTNGVDTGISAGPSQSRASSQRMPFADQLADAINSTKALTVPDACSSSMKVRPVAPTRTPGTPPLSGKSERALDKCKAEPADALLEPSGGELGYASKTTVVERQQRDAQWGFAVQESEQATEAGMKKTTPPLPHDLGGSDSDSEVPLAKRHAVAKPKRPCTSTGSRTRPGKSKEDAPPPPKKRHSRSKAKAPNTDSQPPRTTTTTEADAGGGGRTVQVLQEKIAPMKVPRKRKEQAKASLDKDDNNEQTHGPPKKKRRGADPTTSRGGKENKEMSRSAREVAAKVETDKPLPSPMKQPARPKPASKAKAKMVKPPSRAGVSATGTRSRRLPLNVRRRIKAIAQNLPSIGVIDDDDPIDFLR